MKTLILAVLALLYIPAVFAGDFESKTIVKDDQGHLAYEKVVEVSGIKKEDLYNRVRAWVMENVKTVDQNIQYDDKNFETIITTPTLALENLKGNHVKNQMVNFKLKVQFKEGRMKIVASSFIYYGEDIQGRIFNTPLEDLKITRIIPNPVKKIEEEFDDTFGAFVNALEKSAASKKQDNW